MSFRIDLAPLPRFYKDLNKLSSDLQETVWSKLKLFREDPRHPSLRVKKVKRYKGVWELSITKQHRVTFEWTETKQEEGKVRVAILRRVGTHNILKRP
jgi:plasmid maintenance system killer protein